MQVYYHGILAAIGLIFNFYKFYEQDKQKVGLMAAICVPLLAKIQKSKFASSISYGCGGIVSDVVRVNIGRENKNVASLLKL